MSAQEEIPKINNELEQARCDFNETLMQDRKCGRAYPFDHSSEHPLSANALI